MTMVTGGRGRMGEEVGGGERNVGGRSRETVDRGRMTGEREWRSLETG
jgi:hypothetical protein